MNKSENRKMYALKWWQECDNEPTWMYMGKGHSVSIDINRVNAMGSKQSVKKLYNTIKQHAKEGYSYYGVANFNNMKEVQIVTLELVVTESESI